MTETGRFGFFSADGMLLIDLCFSRAACPPTLFHQHPTMSVQHSLLKSPAKELAEITLANRNFLIFFKLTKPFHLHFVKWLKDEIHFFSSFKNNQSIVIIKRASFIFMHIYNTPRSYSVPLLFLRLPLPLQCLSSSQIATSYLNVFFPFIYGFYVWEKMCNVCRLAYFP